MNKVIHIIAQSKRNLLMKSQVNILTLKLKVIIKNPNLNLMTMSNYQKVSQIFAKYCIPNFPQDVFVI